MNLSSKQIIEITGVIAVVLSLIFVALELRESRIAARTSSYQEVGIAVADSWFLLASDPELLEVMLLLESEDQSLYSNLPDLEQARARSFMIGTLRTYEVLFLQVQEGLLEEDSLRFLGYGEAMVSRRTFRRLWPDIRDRITPEFREYLENKVMERLET